MQPTRQVRLVPASVAERSSDEHDKRMDLTETAEIRKRHCGKEPPVARWHGPGDSPPPYGARSTTLVLRRDADCTSSFGGVCRLLEHGEGDVSERCCQWWSHYCWHSVLDSLSRQQLAELNYVLARWGQSGDPNVTAVVALYTWSVTDAGTYNSHGMSDDDYVARAPSEARSTILSLLAQMRSEAPAYAVTDPSLSLSLSLDMTDQYAGTLTVAANPSHLQGTADLSGAVFGDGSTSLTLGAGQFGITGTPADGASSYQIGASMSVAADGYGAKVDLYTAGASEQRIIASVAGAPGNLAASTQTPQIDLDFQPVIGTQ